MSCAVFCVVRAVADADADDARCVLPAMLCCRANLLLLPPAGWHGSACVPACLLLPLCCGRSAKWSPRRSLGHGRLQEAQENAHTVTAVAHR